MALDGGNDDGRGAGSMAACLVSGAAGVGAELAPATGAAVLVTGAARLGTDAAVLASIRALVLLAKLVVVLGNSRAVRLVLVGGCGGTLVKGSAVAVVLVGENMVALLLLPLFPPLENMVTAGVLVVLLVVC